MIYMVLELVPGGELFGLLEVCGIAVDVFSYWRDAIFWCLYPIVDDFGAKVC